INLVSVATTSDLAFIEGVLGRTPTEDEIEPGNLFFGELGRSLPAHVYLQSEQWMHAYTRRVEAWWHAADDGTPGFDLLVSPVLGGPPPPIGYLSDPEQGLQRVIDLLQYTAQFNITGQPAVSLPLHWTADGLPVGVQLVAAYGREDLLIRVAAQLEQAQPWTDRIPPVHA
ncbi:MAG TPA: amidase family protein, partial [Acidimicrobiales bacterium]